jgi:hypothetical protein
MASNKLIGIIVDQHTKINLLAWTIYYLSGQSNYYYAGFDYWFDVDEEPVSDEASEIEVEVDGSGDIDEFRDFQSSIRSANDFTGLRLICTRISDLKEHNKEIPDAIAECDKLIVVGSNKDNHLYSDKSSKHDDELDDYLLEYFKDSMSAWGDVKDTPWDRREFIALNHRPFNNKAIKNIVDIEHPHFFIDTAELYTDFAKVIPKLFEFIGDPICEERLEQWGKIYELQKNNLRDRIGWDRNFQKIVDSIIAGEDMDLGKFKLDMMRESTILHELLYKHNLNLKAYGLDELPKNTKEIHELLEPNFHTLTEY